MSRDWYILDALHQPRGPFELDELMRKLEKSDAHVWTEGITGWRVGSELFADDEVLARLSADTAPGAHRLAPPTMTDEHGQPTNRLFNAARRLDKSVNELLGMCRGVIADGDVSELEAKALRAWIKANPEFRETFPVNVLADRLERIFADGRVDDTERAELLELLRQTTGDLPGVPLGKTRATRVPVEVPPPEIAFDARLFVLTGSFVFGARSTCEDEIVRRGGKCGRSVTKATDYLVIGEIASADWKNTTSGNKIEQAVDYRERFKRPAIVAEEHWVEAVKRVAR